MFWKPKITKWELWREKAGHSAVCSLVSLGLSDKSLNTSKDQVFKREGLVKISRESVSSRGGG